MNIKETFEFGRRHEMDAYELRRLTRLKTKESPVLNRTKHAIMLAKELNRGMREVNRTEILNDENIKDPYNAVVRTERENVKCAEYRRQDAQTKDLIDNGYDKASLTIARVGLTLLNFLDFGADTIIVHNAISKKVKNAYIKAEEQTETRRAEPIDFTLQSA